MTQWEYRTQDYHQFKSLQDILEHMNELGSEGWELLIWGDNNDAVFKRPGVTREEHTKEILRRLDKIEELLDAIFIHDLESRSRDRGSDVPKPENIVLRTEDRLRVYKLEGDGPRPESTEELYQKALEAFKGPENYWQKQDFDG